MEPNGFQNALDSLGVERGCNGQSVSTAEFLGGESSLELAQPVKLSSDSQISSTFKTSGDGLLMNLEGQVPYRNVRFHSHFFLQLSSY